MHCREKASLLNKPFSEKVVLVTGLYSLIRFSMSMSMSPSHRELAEMLVTYVNDNISRAAIVDTVINTTSLNVRPVIIISSLNHADCVLVVKTYKDLLP